MTETTSTDEAETTWAIDWTLRRTWLRFAGLTLYFSAALSVAVLAMAVIGGRIFGRPESDWLHFAAYLVPVFAAWCGFLVLLDKLLKCPPYVADLNVLTMDRSLITASRITLIWEMCIFVIAILSVCVAIRLEVVDLTFPNLWGLVLLLIPIVSGRHLVWTLRKVLGAELPTERSAREAAVWNRIGPLSIVWNLLLGFMVLSYFVVIALPMLGDG